jgi:ParB/RepB/Spo0J family partition protein
MIRPAGNPIRTSWDEEKMDELVTSVKEQHGVVVPIKVREVSTGYEIIYGHRRFEAAKRAGQTEIECIVALLDDNDSLVQGLIENIQREDMQPMDTAKALKRLQDETKWSQGEIERRGIMSKQASGHFLALLEAPKEVQELVVKAQGNEVPEGKVTEMHYREVRQVIPSVNAVYTPTSEKETKASPISTNNLVTQVIKKAANEGLTSAQTRQVAEEVQRASIWGDRAVQDVITRPYEKKENREYVPTERIKAKVELPDVSHEVFSWLKHPAIVAMHDSNRSASFGVDFLLGDLKKKDKALDKGTAKELLKQEMGILKNILTKIEKGLEADVED